MPCGKTHATRTVGERRCDDVRASRLNGAATLLGWPDFSKFPKAAEQGVWDCPNAGLRTPPLSRWTFPAVDCGNENANLDAPVWLAHLRGKLGPARQGAAGVRGFARGMHRTGRLLAGRTQHLAGGMPGALDARRMPAAARRVDSHPAGAERRCLCGAGLAAGHG